MRWITLCAGLLAGTLSLAAVAPAAAQSFPTGPVKIIIPFPPGGPAISRPAPRAP